jgi:uncharacterized RDD family membrane protein YckC
MSAPNDQIDWSNWIYRLVALVIDSIITGIPAGIIYWGISAALWTTTLYGIPIDGTPWWAGVTLLPFLYGIFLVLYSAILEVTWGGQTLGKKILNLQVQTVHGQRLEFGKDFIRNITKIYGLLLLLDWLLGIVTPGNKNQRYFDQLTDTVVLRGSFSTAAPPPPPPPPPPPT